MAIQEDTRLGSISPFRDLFGQRWSDSAFAVR